MTRSSTNQADISHQNTIYLQAEPDVPPPRRYDGSRIENEAKTFAEETQAIFDLQPRRFNSFAIKMTYISRFLTGSASVWFKLTRDEHVDMQNFWTAFLARFSLNIPNEEKEAQLLTMQIRKNETINDFNCRFRILSAGMDFNDAALKCIYKHSLKTELREKLYNYVPAPNNLDEMMEACEVIEARRVQGEIYQERESSSWTEPRRSTQKFPSYGNRANQTNGNSQKNHHDKPARNVSTALADPRVKEEEHSRRLRLGLCFHCGRQGHRSFDCPSKNGMLRQ